MSNRTQNHEADIFYQKQLYHLFQPILDLNNSQVYGFEALLRSPFDKPDSLFSQAKINNQLYTLDWISIKKAIITFFFSSTSTELLFVNVYPSTISHPSFFENLFEFTYQMNIPVQRIVFEINESEGITDFIKFQKNISDIKKIGYHIAVDDIGMGLSSLTTITISEPEVIKLDKWFSKNLFISVEKQKGLKRMVDFCGKDITLILEGIECQDDLTVAQSLGVSFGQGYLLGLPNILNSELNINIIT